jgi:hypothetical protein
VREQERALEAARAGKGSESALQAFVEAGGAVADATGLGAPAGTAGTGKGWRRWFRRDRDRTKPRLMNL